MDHQAASTKSSRLSTTRVQKALHWFQYVSKGGLPLLLSLVGALLLIFKMLDLNLSTILLILIFEYVIYLYSAPIIKKPNDDIDDVLKFTLPLLWITNLWLIAASFPSLIQGFTPISAFIFGIILSLTPKYFIPILFLISSCFELSFILTYVPSVEVGYFHIGAHLLAILTIPRLVTVEWIIRSFYPRQLETGELPLKRRYFDAKKFKPSHDRQNIVRIGEEVSGGWAAIAEDRVLGEEDWDSTPVKVNGDKLSLNSQRNNQGSSDLVSDVNTINESKVPTEHVKVLNKSATPALSKVTSLIRGYSPIQGEAEIHEAVKAHSEQAIAFINHSLKVHLELLRQQLHVETAVLLWVRSGRTQLEVRAVDTLRDEWILTQFDLYYGILEEALAEPLVFNDPIEAHELVPYYDQSLTIGGLLSMPVCFSDRDVADGILLVDRGSNELWEQSDCSTLRIVADKIALDIETSRLLRQVAYDGGQVERLCYSLRQLNEAFDLMEVAQCCVAGVGSYSGFDSATFFSVHEAEGLRLLSRWLNPQLQASYLTENCLDVGDFIAWSDDSLFKALEEGINLSTIKEPVAPSNYLNIDDYPLLMAASALTIRLCDPQTHTTLGLLLITGSDDEVIQPKNMTALEILFEQVEVKLSSITAHERLKGMALCDGLTGLKNHMTFQSESSEMLKRAERDKAPLTFVLIDIDHFKSVNDTYGHPFGDVVLQKVAETLQSQVRDIDLVARYGGEEFAMVLHGTELDQAFVSVERVRQGIEELTFDHKGKEVQVTISVGLACYPIDSRDKERLVERADKALYQSKRNGRNQLTPWRDIAPEQRDSSVGWTRHPVAFSLLDGEDQAISSVVVPSLQERRGELPFDFEQMISTEQDDQGDWADTETRSELTLNSHRDHDYDD